MKHHDILIVGGGISGIGAAARLRQQGISDFALIEKASALGGTWRDNTYPGCACDVPSVLYSYSFAPNPGWSRGFAEQPEILAYVHDVARKHHIEGHVRLGVELQRDRWNAKKKH